jgi:general secretion pathway protein G
MKRSLSSDAGFTLLEIMLVVMIIVMLAGLALYGLSGGQFQEAQKAKALADISGLGTQLMIYQAQNGFPPSTEQGLKALVTKPEGDPPARNWRQYLSNLPLDPFTKQDYHYLYPGRHNPNSFDLYSAGRDGKYDTDDDVGNWNLGR